MEYQFAFVGLRFQQEKLRKQLKLKLEMAKFLQDTIEETAVQRKKPRSDMSKGFATFMEKVRPWTARFSFSEILFIYLLIENLLHLCPVSSSCFRVDGTLAQTAIHA